MHWVSSPAQSAVRFVILTLDGLAVVNGEFHALRASVEPLGNIGEGARRQATYKLLACHKLTVVAYARAESEPQDRTQPWQRDPSQVSTLFLVQRRFSRNRPYADISKLEIIYYPRLR